MNKFGYPDLQDADFLFEALLGYGMFADKLPPCFTSESLLDYAKNNKLSPKNKNHAYIEYQSTRNINIPRQFGIPHPEAYWRLCECIRDHWKEINEHIGAPKTKFNFCHARKIRGKNYIFEMNYNVADKWHQEELKLDYALGCKYVVLADISTCFPSIYAHSIPWAVKDKEWSKSHCCTSWSKAIKGNKCNKCKKNKRLLCNHEKNEVWPNDLDTISRSIKDGETNGLLIGPHTSNIISEIILTQVDVALQQANFGKIIRHIDDYSFFAQDELQARDFLRTLNLELKKYGLVLNGKKTKIIPFYEFMAPDWVSKLSQFAFPSKEQIGFTTINFYIDYALALSRENNDYAVLNYVIKSISKKQLTDRSKRLYIKKMVQTALDYPYILPLLKDNVFIFADDEFGFLSDFLKELLDRSLQNWSTDSLAFVFYYAMKYKITIKISSEDVGRIIGADDCISLLLAYKYCKSLKMEVDQFVSKAKQIQELTERDQDKFWLFLYEVFSSTKQTGLLKKLKESNVSFFKHEEFTHE